MDELRQSQKDNLQNALDMDEIATSRGLNQKLDLIRAGDTRWGSHYKAFQNFIILFDSIIDDVDTLVEDANTSDERAKKHQDILKVFKHMSMGVLQNQPANYIIDACDIDKRFSDLGGFGELSRKLVETKKNLTYPFIFRSVKFALLLLVATATVERAFSAMKYIKNDLRNRMDDEFLDGCIVPYVEKKVFRTISNESIIKTFQDMKPRRVQL
ncbi:hypothetical protein H5410_057550 [Solanum commersonii]|uniref:HAT C-terminal dimerisation domain-containing protein n=1 Tax=Solanum commersonii TaxID=4109 RepID=A0A9J5WQX5_SOLCO|nr:hypothetical protein H5410_057550 [Solanum commersonii]